MTVGPFYTGQIPTEPLRLTIFNDDGTLRDLTAFGQVDLLLWDASHASVDTSAGDAIVGSSNPGILTYVWPTSPSLFASTGTYRYQVRMDSDYSSVETFEVLSVGSFTLTPTVGQLAAFWGEEAPTDDAAWLAGAAANLQQATDLLTTVTGVSSFDDPRQLRLAQYAIMDMAIMQYMADPSEANSPYSSERIGSYSYTLKNYSFTRASQGATGLFWWDQVVQAIVAGEWDSSYSLVVAGEHVFHRDYRRWVPSERLLHQAPLSSPPGSFEDPTSGANRWLPFGETSDGSWAGDPYSWPF